ncbi:MAG TPA: response regulator [Candidatus Acidoferrales bacterium]|nr:response regulator [Candidatus Acidoferrales bacterium]
MDAHRLLFVDDEPNIRMTLPAILQMHGFDVTTTATVAEALLAMQNQAFDVLLADLNIGQPGDGFTVVSAMRRTQPEALTFILTGFPAFETALEAIRAQVDDYLVKPANIQQLVQMIETKLSSRVKRSHGIKPRQLSVLLREQKDEIVERWLQDVAKDEDLSRNSLQERERVASIAALIEELAKMIETSASQPSPEGFECASLFGRLRHSQGYTLSMVMHEIRLLRLVVNHTAQENLLALNSSMIISEMIQLGDSLDRLLRIAVEAFCAEHTETHPGAPVERSKI